MTEIKELLLARLEGKSKQEFLYEKYVEAEAEFIKSLSDLSNYDKMCECENIDTIASTIYSDYDQPQVIQRCLKCGGDIPS